MSRRTEVKILSSANKETLYMYVNTKKTESYLI